MPKLRCLTYNIRLCLEEGFEPVLETILKIDADIVALQEVGDFWPHGPQANLTEKLALRAGYRHWFFAGALFESEGAYGIGLLSRLPFEGIESSKLPRVSDEQRLLLSLKIPKIKTKLWTSHISVVKEDRDLQLNWLSKKIAVEKPDILLGDMNTSMDDPLLSQLNMSTTFRAEPPLTYPSQNPTQSIDHIFFGPAYSLAIPAKTLNSSASDHLPVFAELNRKL